MSTDARLRSTLEHLPHSAPSPCSYLPDRVARHQAFHWDESQGRMPGTLYQDLMDHRFRRSGRLFYRPACGECASCIPIRVDVRSFEPSASQRRNRRKNEDVRVRWATPELNRERVELYQRYAAHRHPETTDAVSTLESFLYDSPVETVEATYWLDGRLIGAGICDVTPRALSTVYFYFDPEESKRGLGTFSALIEIETARRLDLAHYYLGYWVPGCRKMEYKSAIGPHELLGIDGWTA